MKRLLLVAFSVVVVYAFIAPVFAQDDFGRSVAVGDREVFVGEPGNNVPSGLVYVYRRDSGGWSEVAALTAADARDGDGFGTALATQGDELLISAVTDERGVVYLFERDGRDWRQAGTLVADAGGPGERFGSAMLLDDDMLYVGATGADDNKGATYVFTRGAGGWRQVARLAGDDIEEGPEEEEAEQPRRRFRGPVGPQFGSSIAVAGEHLLIGAPGTSRGAGMVYAFRRDGEDFERIGRFPEEGASGARFGSALLIHRGVALIGASGSNGGVGSVVGYRYDEESGEWRAAITLQPFEASPGAGFGSSIVAAGDEIFVGTPGSGGAIYRFEAQPDDDGGIRVAAASKVGPAGLSGREQFAATLAMAGDVMVAGMPGDDRGAGTAMIMTRGYEGWDRTKVISEMKGLPAMSGELHPCTDGMIDRYPCEGVDILAFVPFREMGGSRGMTTNDIWGWTDPETGTDYALVCMTDKMAFVDVSDPYNPIFVGTLPMTEGARPSTWRDIKVSNNHGYIVSDSAGEHGVQVFDLTHLREFEGEPIVFTEDAHYDRINSAHNIVIDEDSRFAFVVGASGGGETCGGGLHMINIEDPKRPAFAGCFADPSTGRRGTGYSHDAQCVVYKGPDSRYTGHEICFGSNETALSIADVTDKRNPVALGMSTYPNVAYTHQGWLTEDQAYFYMNDEGDEPQGLVEGTRTLVWDVRELDDPVLVAEYIADVTSTDHNLYVVGDRMYQSNYDSGLRVFDVSDPENIAQIGYFDTNPEGMSGASSWSNYPFFDSGIIVFTAGRSGMFVARVSEQAR